MPSMLWWMMVLSMMPAQHSPWNGERWRHFGGGRSVFIQWWCNLGLGLKILGSRSTIHSPTTLLRPALPCLQGCTPSRLRAQIRCMPCSTPTTSWMKVPSMMPAERSPWNGRR